MENVKQVMQKMSGEALKMAQQYPRKFWEL